MAEQIQIRARMQGNEITEVKILLVHEMETGLRKDPKTKNLIPAHYIMDVVVTLNGKTALVAQWSSGISKNPFLGMRLVGAKVGDFVAISAVDNLGGKYEHNAIVV